MSSLARELSPLLNLDATARARCDGWVGGRLGRPRQAGGDSLGGELVGDVPVVG